MQYPSLYLAIIGIFVFLAHRLIVWWRRRELARKFGCRPIAKYPYTEPFGKDYDRELKEAFQSGGITKFFSERYDKVGSSTYELHTLNDNVIVTRDHTNVKAVASNPNDWERESRFAGRPFTGENITNTNGMAWKQTRDLMVPLFKRAELNDINNFKVFVDRMIALIPRDGSTLDMQPLVRKLFLDNATDFIFGESVDSLRDTTGKPEEFLAALNRANTEAGKRIRPTGYMSTFYSYYTYDKKWRADCKIVHDFVDGCIARHRNSVKCAKDASEQRERYVLIEGMSQAIPDPVKLRFELLGIFSIARENSAMSFANVLFLLARNPHIWTELRQTLADIENEPITFDHLKSLPLFRYTVLEGLRLHSPIIRNRRVAAHDAVLPRGGGPDGSSPALVSKGSIVWYDLYESTRDPKVWGEDVDVFRPSRFEGRKIGSEFTPFSVGPRMCPANQQVIAQSMYLLFRLVREFESIENRDSCLEFQEAVHMCLHSKNGCKIALHPAKA